MVHAPLPRQGQDAAPAIVDAYLPGCLHKPGRAHGYTGAFEDFTATGLLL